MSTNAAVHAEVKRVASIVRAILAHEKAEIEDYYTIDLSTGQPYGWVFSCGCQYLPLEDFEGEYANLIYPLSTHGGVTGRLVKACLGARLSKNNYNN